MLNRPCDSWERFEQRLLDFFRKSPLDRQRFVFRGQGSSVWPLEATLDRYVAQFSLKDRKAVSEQLLDQFRRCSTALLQPEQDLAPIELELLARHHGLPSLFTDWSRSPYVAAYFAFADPVHDSVAPPADVAIWCVDLSVLDTLNPDDIDILQDFQAIRLNPRAIEQQAVFIRVRSEAKPVPVLLDRGLRRFTIPASERWRVLERLEYMRIDASMLFRSLDGAAAAAAMRVRNIHRGAR